MSGLDELLRGQVAAEVLGVVMRDLTRRVRTNGGSVPPWAQAVCEALAAAADQPPPAPLARGLSATGPAFGSVGAGQGWLPAREAADLVGCSERHVRRPAATGRVRGQRAGSRTWLIDPESLRSVLRRAA